MSQLNPDLPPYWFVSTPRQAGKSLRQRCVEAVEITADQRKQIDDQFRLAKQAMAAQFFIGWDLAKPGSDQTVVTVIPTFPIKPEWVEGFHPIVHAPVTPKQPDTEHIWNMIVLAAESSRYG